MTEYSLALVFIKIMLKTAFENLDLPLFLQQRSDCRALSPAATLVVLTRGSADNSAVWTTMAMLGRQFDLPYRGVAMKQFSNSYRLRQGLVSSFVAMLILTAVVSSAIGQIELIGPGVAGQVHALAYDPDDSTGQTIYAGGDVAGVFMTTDGGDHWQLINNGIANKNLTFSYYIDDLIVLGLESGLTSDKQGVYAATHGGIYFRQAGTDLWVLQTDGIADTHTYSGGTAGAREIPIPFSCFAYDPEGRVLYAGAGHGRWKASGEWREYYPEYGPPTGKYSLWKCSFQGGGEWHPIPESENLGITKQIAIVDRGVDDSEIVFASRHGIRRLKTNPTDIGEIWF